MEDQVAAVEVLRKAQLLAIAAEKHAAVAHRTLDGRT